MVCDELSRLPLFATCVSGHTSDKTSFRNIIIDYWKLIKQQFSELRYLVGDSALCTSETAMTAARNGIYFVSRIPRTLRLSPVLRNSGHHLSHLYL